jgi:hypothetical protein
MYLRILVFMMPPVECGLVSGLETADRAQPLNCTARGGVAKAPCAR